MTRRQGNTFAESRGYSKGYEDGFERGQRAAAIADRFFWTVLGFLSGAILILVIRSF